MAKDQQVTYPQVTVKLVGQDSNAFNLIGLTMRALKKAGIPADELKALQTELFHCGSYDMLLQKLMLTVNVE